MARRREIKSIVNSFMQSFSSRNNDVNGYWGVGKLYKFAQDRNVSDLTMALIQNGMIPTNNTEDLFPTIYLNKIERLFQQQGVPFSWAQSILISIHFSMADDGPIKNYLGDHFEATITLVNDQNQKYVAKSNGRCRPHDPTREKQRGV